MRTGYLDTKADTLEETLAIVENSHADGKPVSVGLPGNAAEIYPQILAGRVQPDVVTVRRRRMTVNGYRRRLDG